MYAGVPMWPHESISTSSSTSPSPAQAPLVTRSPQDSSGLRIAALVSAVALALVGLGSAVYIRGDRGGGGFAAPRASADFPAAASLVARIGDPEAAFEATLQATRARALEGGSHADHNGSHGVSHHSGSPRGRNDGNGKNIGAGCKGLQKSDGMAILYTDPEDETSLYVDLTDLLGERGAVELLAIALFARGTYTSRDGQVSTLHLPLTRSDETLVQLSLSADRKSVDVSRPQLDLRTSDRQTREALRLGAWGGWEDSMHRVVAKDCDALGEEKVIVRGADLINNGFFIEGWDLAVSSYQIRGARSFESNIIVTVEMIAMSDPRVQDETQLKDVEAAKLPKEQALTVSYTLMRLPQRPMAPRPADDRVGFLTVDYIDLGQRTAEEEVLFGLPDEAADTRVFLIQRFNLKASAHPEIRIHVDPTVPPRWRGYFKQGIEAWNDAFDPLGYKDLVRAVLPGDKDWPRDYDAGDAQFSTISWSIDYSGSTTYSVGISKVDPRSGQILKSDIVMTSGWVHNWLGSLGRLIPKSTQLSHGYRREEVSTDATATPLSAVGLAVGPSLGPEEREALMGAGLRSVVMHEMGHVLGLRHNFKGSLGISPECTRNSSCTSKHGLSVSVMDYLPVNVPVNVPASGVLGVDLFTTTVGEYDKLAIRYGYAEEPPSEEHTAIEPPSPFRPPAFLEPTLRQAEQMPFCSDGDWEMAEDPLCEVHDLTSSPLDFYEDRLTLIGNSFRKLCDASVMPGKSYTNCGKAADYLIQDLVLIGNKLVVWIGGMNISSAHRSGRRAEISNVDRVDGASSSRVHVVARPIAATTQRKALRILLGIFSPFKSPLLPLEDNDGYLVEKSPSVGKASFYSIATMDLHAKLRQLQRQLLSQVMEATRLTQVADTARIGVGDDGERGLTCRELLEALEEAIWPNSTSVNAREDRDLQARFVDNLADLSAASKKRGDFPMEVLSDVLQQSLKLRRRLERRLSSLVGESSARAYVLHVMSRLPNPEQDALSGRCGRCRAPEDGGGSAEISDSGTAQLSNGGRREGFAAYRRGLTGRMSREL